MMSGSKSTLSQTLQSITSIKLRELQKQRDSFNSRKDKIYAQANGAVDDQSKIRVLLEGIAKVHASNTSRSLDQFQDWELNEILGDPTLSNIRRFVHQSQYDPSLPASILSDFKSQLYGILEKDSRKLDYANLYSRLLTEWLGSDAANLADSADNTSSDDEFEVVERQKERLHQLSEKFESVVFSAGEVDVDAIQRLLEGLFDNEGSKKALALLRERISGFGNRLANEAKPFTKPVLEWCIRGLLQSDLLSDQKKNTLEDFIKDKVVLAEIADVLNMRFVDLEGWSWDADEGIPVAPRRQLNGKYRVVMDEDILQAIFLHYISMSWSVEFKAELKDMVRNKDVWPWTQSMPRDELEKREYYLGRGTVRTDEGIAWERQNTYVNDFFMCQLPSDLDAGNGGYEDDADEKPRRAASSSMKQQLLRTIGTEVLANRCLNQTVAVVQSDLQWFATSTSHTTVNTILEFFGVPDVWTRFFQRYLEAPLRMVGLAGESTQVRTRKRGVPIGHIFQKLFGELIIFTMDLAVNQEANMLLYRLHDDLWLCGDPAKCVKAWMTIERCASVLGLQFNDSKTGSAYLAEDANKDAHVLDVLPKGRVILGFLELDAHTGDWVIDHNQVDAHIRQLGKQLAGCNSVFSWIQTWNSCIGRFFNYTFGQPANCFGQRHVDMILTTHQRMQQELFTKHGGGARPGSVTEYLQRTIEERFEVADVPDAFLYFPEELGGLGVRNPFISLLAVRDQLLRNPEARMADFLKQERKAYEAAKANFDALNDRDRSRRLDAILGKSSSATDFIPLSAASDESSGRREPSWAGPKGSGFMTFDEYTRYRETSSAALRAAYIDLLILPSKSDAQLSWEVSNALDNLAVNQPELSRSRLGSDRNWLIQLHSKDAFKRFGGLSIVDQGLLPMGVMTLLRDRKVTWQTVL